MPCFMAQTLPLCVEGWGPVEPCGPRGNLREGVRPLRVVGLKFRQTAIASWARPVRLLDSLFHSPPTNQQCPLDAARPSTAARYGRGQGFAGWGAGGVCKARQGVGQVAAAPALLQASSKPRAGRNKHDQLWPKGRMMGVERPGERDRHELSGHSRGKSAWGVAWAP